MQRFVQLNEWFHSPKGRKLASAISEQLEDLLPRYYGVHLVQFGLEEHGNWLSSSQINNQHILTTFLSHRPHAVIAKLEGRYLPFESESVSLIVLPLTLELVSQRQLFLQEINRVLTQDGRVLIIGLNPHGILGLRKKFRRTVLGIEKRKTLLSLVKLNKLLSTASFSLTHTHFFSYTPFLKLNRKSSFFFEQLGKMLWPYPGNFYILEAKKKPSLSVTPIIQYGQFVVGRPN